MSLRAILWALEDAVCPTPQSKLVLAIFANFASDRMRAYPALASVRKMTGLDERTIRRCVADLESAGLLFDSGERVGRTKNVRVFILPVRTPANMSGFKAEAVDKSNEISAVDAPENRTPANMSGLDAEAELNPCKDAGVTPANMSGEPVKEPLPLETAKAVSVPKGTETAAARGTRMTSDWVPPEISDLPANIAARVSGWPTGAYADQADAFRDFWIAESGPRAVKRDWSKAWHSWIRRAGKVTAPPVARQVDPDAPPRAQAPVLERLAEGEWAGRLRAVLEVEFGAQRWWDLSGFAKADPGLKIFVLPWMRDAVFAQAERIRALAEAGGFAFSWVSIENGKVTRA